MAIMGGEETATETIDMVPAEKVKPSQFGEFCRRNGINPNLIMLKITLFVMYGARRVNSNERVGNLSLSSVRKLADVIKSRKA
ncbi:unnamed protein product [Ceratitis capitata]|uniref:(Mediterranean fruit fly) hypothetical protein n=1 Tax=Ceratitis capitata TaxID=7213 RepID=A0A811US69_CERCA|nr:unnamed protein product [Ceratitis capitata]